MLSKVASGVAGMLLLSAPLRADLIWANDARGNTSHIEEFDTATGALVTSFLAPNPDAAGQIGRGIAVVGSSIYYSVDNSGDVFLTNPTGVDLGVAFDTGLPGIASIASDGQFLYVTPTNGSVAVNETVLKYSLTGSLLGTLTLTPSGGPSGALGRTGLEVAGNDFIANQGNNEGPYDEFDSSGALLMAAFLNLPGFGFTGVAFNGSTYFVSDEEAAPSTLRLFNSSGGSLGSVTLTGCPGPNQQCDLQDLSLAVSAVPEPSTVALLAVAILGISMFRRRNARRA